MLSRDGAGALTGEPGIGKTVSALGYAEMALKEGRYQQVVWLNAADRMQLRRSALTVCVRLGLLPRESVDGESALIELGHWLAKTPEALLVLDNADEPGVIPSDWAGLPSSVLVTARTAPDGFRAIPLRPLTEERPAELLLRQSGRIRKNGSLKLAPEVERALARSCGRNPLKVSIVAGKVRASGQSVCDYLKRDAEPMRRARNRRARVRGARPAASSAD